MINVTFYYFSKRRNSTALPGSGVASAVAPVLLKERCSQLRPVLELESSDPDNYNNYNYIYIPFFGRYYWVVNKEVDTGKRLFIYCEIDVLGSFKAQIQSSSAFVKYSMAGVYTIPDTRIARTMGYTINSSTASFPMSVGGNNYFISMTGLRGTSTYSISKNNLLQLFQNAAWVRHTPSGGAASVEDAITDFATMLGECIDDFTTQGSIYNYLRSAYILPFPPNEEVISAAKDIYAGHYNTEVSGYEVLDSVYEMAIAISIPWNASDWRRCSPYSEVYLYLPFFGVIPLDTNSIVNSSYLTVKYAICYSDGGLCYSVETDTNRIISTGSTNVRSEYGLGSSNLSVGNAGFIPSLIAEASSTFSAGLDSGILNTLAGISDSFGKGFSTSGGLGGLAACGLELRLKCWCITKNLSDTQANFASVLGLPTFRYMSLSTLSGYVECEDYVSAAVSATLEEKNMISNYMNNGMYIE